MSRRKQLARILRERGATLSISALCPEVIKMKAYSWILAILGGLKTSRGKKLDDSVVCHGDSAGGGTPKNIHVRAVAVWLWALLRLIAVCVWLLGKC